MYKKILVEVVSLTLVCATLLLLKSLYPALPQASPAQQASQRYHTVELPEKPAERIDINLASLNDLQSIKGVGQAIAKRIVDDRTQRGYYYNVNEILRVRGIGKKTFAKMRRQITVDKRNLMRYLGY